MSYAPFLKHVCMWTERAWRPITAQEAHKISGRNGVSSKSRMFMCALCGNYVTLAAGNKREPHFKHSSEDANKECKERRFNTAGNLEYNPRAHTLPIRIVIDNKGNFSFEIGLIRAPIENLKSDFRVEISPTGQIGSKFIYTKERLNPESITYLNIGSKPHPRFTIELSKNNEVLRNFWPHEVEGINPQGALFKASTGRMLTFDADVVINKEYYLLKPQTVAMHVGPSIDSTFINLFQYKQQYWALYKIKALKLDEAAARFFLQFHCRLTDSPVRVQTVWPLHTEGSFTIKHNSDNLHVLVSGNTQSIHSFPSDGIAHLNKGNNERKLYKIKCSGRQQLITTGRAHILRYTYFWKEPLTYQPQVPEIEVFNIKSQLLQAGIHKQLPPQNTLRVNAPFDGTIVVRQNQKLICKHALKADTTFSLRDIRFGSSISVLIGADAIWQASFVDPNPSAASAEDTLDNDLSYLTKPSTIYQDNAPSHSPTAHKTVPRAVLDSFNETDLMHKLMMRTEPAIPAPHSLGTIYRAMHDYPKVAAWIRKRLKDGNINQHAYRILQKAYQQVQANR